MDGTPQGLKSNESSLSLESEARYSQTIQQTEDMTDSGTSANRMVPEETSFSIRRTRNVLHENFSIFPCDESKIINEEGGQDHVNRTSLRNIGPVELQHVSPRFNRSGEYPSAIASTRETDSILHRTYQRDLSDPPCSRQQTPEKLTSPRSEVLDSPASALHRMCVEMSPLNSSLHGQPCLSESVAAQATCSTPKARPSACRRRFMPSPSHNFDDNIFRKRNQEGNCNSNLIEERNHLKLLLEKQKEQHQYKRKLLDEKLAEVARQKEAVKKQIDERAKHSENVLMERFEKFIAELIKQKEKVTQEFTEHKAELVVEKEEMIMHVNNQELALKDLRSKYEKNRMSFMTYDDRHEDYQQTIADRKTTLKETEQAYESLKAEAAAHLQRCNETWIVERQTHHAEITKLKAMKKRLEINISSNEEAIAQKIKENKKLTRIYTELQNDLCGRMTPGPFRFLDTDESDESGIHV